MEIAISTLRINDYNAVMALWNQCDGIGLSEADSRESIQAYLDRNPGMSFIASAGDGAALGAILAGHDGRRGYLHHLAVHPSHRRKGIGGRLVEHALAALKEAGIGKVHLFIFNTNTSGLAFWEASGWKLRTDIAIVSKTIESC
ncbi:MAG: GNAT family N-acetyltransferase [Opitutales bacterium]|nr:GNAT family N-acetyltransferase [Opitutales bacterium]